jgi:endodeoxyribonuclease
MSKVENSNLEFRKVKSLDFLYEINSNGTIFRNVKSKKQLKIQLDMHHSEVGYYAIFVRHKKKTVRRMIHRMVAECWIGDIPKELQVDHIDRNTHNNDYRNLRIVTFKEQMQNRSINLQTIMDNCMEHVIKRRIPITLTHRVSGEEFKFESQMDCAAWLAEQYDKKSEAMRHRLKKRREVVFDYNVDYGKSIYERNAETGYADSKE